MTPQQAVQAITQAIERIGLKAATDYQITLHEKQGGAIEVSIRPDHKVVV